MVLSNSVGIAPHQPVEGCITKYAPVLASSKEKGLSRRCPAMTHWAAKEMADLAVAGKRAEVPCLNALGWASWKSP